MIGIAAARFERAIDYFLIEFLAYEVAEILPFHQGLVQVLEKDMRPLRRAAAEEVCNYQSVEGDSEKRKALQDALIKVEHELLACREGSTNCEPLRDAAKAFASAMSYVQDYKDARSRYEANRAAAVQRVAILPFKNLTGRRVYAGTGTVISNRIILEAMRHPDNLEFMDLVTRENIDEVVKEVDFGQSGYVDPATAAEVGRILGVNAFVVGSITSVSTDYPPDVVERFEEEDKISQGKDRPKRTVRASVTVTRREASAHVSCTYQVIDVRTGKIQSVGESEGGVVFRTAFGRYRGDKEALSRQSRQLCAVRETYPPPDDELVRQAAEDVARDLSGQITSYFR